MGSRTAPVVSSSDVLSSSENKIESKGIRACSDSYANVLPADVIEKLVDHYRLSIPPYNYRIPALTERACSPSQEGDLVVYYDALVAGLRLPFPQIFIDIFRFYNVCPSQLSPNSWRILCGFVIILSQNNLVPSVHLFNLLFSLNKDRNMDWYYFCARQGSEDWGFPIKWGVLWTHIATKEKPDSREMEIVKRLQKLRLGPLNELLTDRLLQENGLYLAMGNEMPSDKGVDIADKMRAIYRAKKQKEKALSKTKGQVVSGASLEKRTSGDRGEEAVVKTNLPKSTGGTNIGIAKEKGLLKGASSRKRGQPLGDEPIVPDERGRHIHYTDQRIEYSTVAVPVAAFLPPPVIETASTKRRKLVLIDDDDIGNAPTCSTASDPSQLISKGFPTTSLDAGSFPPPPTVAANRTFVPGQLGEGLSLVRKETSNVPPVPGTIGRTSDDEISRTDSGTSEAKSCRRINRRDTILPIDYHLIGESVCTWGGERVDVHVGQFSGLQSVGHLRYNLASGKNVVFKQSNASLKEQNAILTERAKDAEDEAQAMKIEKSVLTVKITTLQTALFEAEGKEADIKAEKDRALAELSSCMDELGQSKGKISELETQVETFDLQSADPSIIFKDLSYADTVEEYFTKYGGQPSSPLFENEETNLKDDSAPDVGEPVVDEAAVNRVVKELALIVTSDDFSNSMSGRDAEIKAVDRPDFLVDKKIPSTVYKDIDSSEAINKEDPIVVKEFIGSLQAAKDLEIVFVEQLGGDNAATGVAVEQITINLAPDSTSIDMAEKRTVDSDKTSPELGLRAGGAKAEAVREEIKTLEAELIKWVEKLPRSVEAGSMPILGPHCEPYASYIKELWNKLDSEKKICRGPVIINPPENLDVIP
ncbi:hypothetical protein J5N97_028204 [Dioscorea zingiberensis]|uniref:Transposase (putative) gypsy type domain-containing protein n=1 Tax=Dioscorea zingiberensis TaxID=325984 RepID=A0A9D5BY32_9LILI|nr:hypothetical protein J5N97_028204 [Dioscorea zingiberensis]